MNEIKRWNCDCITDPTIDCVDVVSYADHARAVAELKEALRRIADFPTIPISDTPLAMQMADIARAALAKGLLDK